MYRIKYFRGCCDFNDFLDDFLDGFMKAARDYDVPLILIDKLQARKGWRKGMTGSEALLMQRDSLINEGEYIWSQSKRCHK